MPARLNTYLGIAEGTYLVGSAYVDTVAFCPADRGERYHRQLYSSLSYLPNAFCGGDWNITSNSRWVLLSGLTQYPNSLYPVRTTLNTIKNPASFMVLIDQRDNMLRTSLTFTNPMPYVAIRHHRSANVLLADLHAKRLDSTIDSYDNFTTEISELMDDR